MDKSQQPCRQKPNFHIMASKTLDNLDYTSTSIIDHTTLDPSLQVVNVMSLSHDKIKSLTAFYLAKSFANEGYNTLLLEANLRHSRYTTYFNLNLDKGLSDSIEEETLHTVNYQNNLDILAGGTSVIDVSSFLVSRDFKAFLKTLKTLYDKIIIDTPTLSEHKDSLIISDYACGNIIVHTSLRDTY